MTLWSKDLDQDGQPDVDDGQLRLLAQDVLQAIKEVKNTGNAFIVGGRREQVTVDVYPERLSGYDISLDQVAQTLKTANAETMAGGVESSGAHFSVSTGSFLKSADEINRLVVGTHQNVPIYVRDLARVVQGPEDAEQLVAYYTGPAGPEDLKADGVPAVTIAIAKKELTNGVTVANAIIERVEQIKGERIPNNVEVSITRNYGETADDKVSDLIKKLFIATFFVFLLVWGAFRALRPAIVVLLVIPVVLLMTIFTAWVWGYTIDRVSLFALIFSIGILVDDAIVVIENIYRRWLEEGHTDDETAVDAVREVGNPTILATFTVIAALLPMGFVSGMMGPYMEPIPALGSVAMFISLFAAFVFTPYFALSKWLRPSMRYLETSEKREHKGAERLEKGFRKILTPLIGSKGKRTLFRLALWGIFLFTCAFFYFKWVPVKMLPLDNKPEFSVVIDMPEGTALPVTANLAHRMAEELRTLPEVTAIQLYAGTARPFDFNGMVRHYYMRSDPWQGELQVQLLHKNDRERSSHELAVTAREMLAELAEKAGANIAVVEMPPGPPVLQSVVAEIHGPTPEIRRQFAHDMTEFFAQAESARDVDNYLRDTYDYWRFDVDTEKAVRRGISVDTINRNLAMALGGAPIGDVKQKAGHEPIEIVVQVPLAERSQIERLGDLPIQSNSGFTIPLRELGAFQRVPEEAIIYRKDLRAVEFVVADVGGTLAAPVYAMFQIQDAMDAAGYKAPDGSVPQAYWIGPPPNDRYSAWEWSGEWTVTYETFRDMGAAFMVALVLIYILVVWEFGNFRIPLVIMAPIPLTLLGIIPAHLIMFELGLGGEFTATSMIGWIALAGIIVRNSILLVDFSIHEVQKGVPVAEAVIRACKTRTRPIVITALALVAGSSVIFTDPIFQGMAISLASGVLVSTVLTLVVIPLGCVAASGDLCEVAAATAPAGTNVPCATAEAKEEPKVEQEPKKKAPRSGTLTKVWGYLAEGIIMGFYLIRGLFLLLYDFLKGLVKKKQPTPKPPASPATPDTSGGDRSGGSDTPPTSVSGSGSAPVSTPTDSAAATTEQAPSTPAETASAPQTEETDALAVREEATDAGPQKDAVAPERESRQDMPEIYAEQTATSSASQATVGATPTTDANDAKTTATTDAASDTTEEMASKPQTDPAVTAERDASAAQKEATDKETADDTRKERAATKKPVAKKATAKPKTTNPASVRKKPRRRGIRLKADDGQGPSFD